MLILQNHNSDWNWYFIGRWLVWLLVQNGKSHVISFIQRFSVNDVSEIYAIKTNFDGCLPACLTCEIFWARKSGRVDKVAAVDLKFMSRVIQCFWHGHITALYVLTLKALQNLLNNLSASWANKREFPTANIGTINLLNLILI